MSGVVDPRPSIPIVGTFLPAGCASAGSWAAPRTEAPAMKVRRSTTGSRVTHDVLEGGEGHPEAMLLKEVLGSVGLLEGEEPGPDAWDEEPVRWADNSPGCRSVHSSDSGRAPRR